MKTTKNNVPIYAEEQIINEELEILNKQKIIPQNFVELTTRGKNYMCSTEGWKEPICERYGFAYENGKKWITLDIPQNLMEKLGLELNKNCSNLIFISPEVLKRKPECGGITLQNEKEIFLASEGSKLVREKETQTGPNIKEFTDLEKQLKELNTKYNQLRSATSNILYPEAIIPALAILDEHLITQAQEAITKLNNLRREKNQAINQNRNLQQNITTLQNKITQLDNTLRTTRQERDQIQQSLKRNLISSLFKNKQKNKRIRELNNSLSFLRGLLVDKNQQLTNLNNDIATRNQTINNLNAQINQLITQRNNLQTQINNLNQQLTIANNTITNLQNSKRSTEQFLKQWTDKFIGKNADQVVEWLNEKDWTIDGLNSQISFLNSQLSSSRGQASSYSSQVGSLQNEISSLQTEISNLRSKSIDNYPLKEYWFISSIGINLGSVVSRANYFI